MYLCCVDDKGVVTLKIHHGGTIVKSQHKKGPSYVGGTVAYYDWCPVEYINMLEIFHIAKKLGYLEAVSVKGLTSDEWVDIDTDAKLLWWCGLVPLSYERVVVIHLEDNVFSSNEDGDYEHEDCEHEESNEDSEHDESEHEGQETDPEFVDSAYEQSDEDQCLLEKDDRAFDNYVDHNAHDADPNAAEEEEYESVDVATSDVKSLDNSSG